jgi:histidinol-phosphate aminotransferase
MSESPLQYVKGTVREKQVYSLPKIEYEIKANQNENPYDLPEKVKNEILAAIRGREWNRYPRLGSGDLRSKLATWLSVEAEQVLVGNGSNEILLAIMNALLEPGKSLVTIEPTFSLYKHYGEILGATVKTVSLGENFAYDTAALQQVMSEPEAALTILCSPNNPTGSVLGQESLKDLLEAARGFVVMDEAYFNFCDQDFLPLLRQYPNLVINRTYSKAFAFAFGRFGYGIATREFAEEIYKVLLPYNLSGFTETAAAALIHHANDLQPKIQEITAERDRFIQDMKKIRGLQVFNSHANFFLIKPEIGSEKLYCALLDRKIVIRDVSYYPGLKNHLRVTVGTREENERMAAAVQEILGR